MSALHKFLLAFLCLVIFLQLFFSAQIINNVRSSPDRGSHLLVAGNFWKHLTLSADDLWDSGAERGHAYQVFSPVPYWTYLPGGLFSDFSPRLAQRFARHVSALLVSILNLLAGFFLGFMMLQSFCPSAASRWLGACLFAVTLTSFPQIGILNSFVNADNFTITICFFITAYAFYLHKTGAAHLKSALIVGLLSSLLLHAKANAYPFLIFILSMFLLAVLKSAQSRLNKITVISLALALIVVLVMPFHYALWLHLGQDNLLPGKIHLAFMDNTFRGRGEFTSDPSLPFEYAGQEKKSSLSSRFKNAAKRTQDNRRYTGFTFLGEIFKICRVSPEGILATTILLVFSLAGCIAVFFNARLKSRIGPDLLFFGGWFLILFAATAVPLMLMPIAVQGRLLLPLLSLLGPMVILGMSSLFGTFKINWEKAFMIACFCWLLLFCYIRIDMLQRL